MIVVISMQLKGVAGLALRKTFERDIRNIIAIIILTLI